MADLGDARTWGVGLDDVSRLAPQVSVLDLDAQGGPPTADPEYGGRTRSITTEDVRRWIHEVAARVNARVTVLGLESAGLGDALHVVAHDATANGAAAYLVDAAFPARSGVNDQASYGAVLWARYREAMDELQALADAIERRRAAGEDVGGAPAVVMQPGGEFPATAFPDGARLW